MHRMNTFTPTRYRLATLSYLFVIFVIALFLRAQRAFVPFQIIDKREVSFKVIACLSLLCLFRLFSVQLDWLNRVWLHTDCSPTNPFPLRSVYLFLSSLLTFFPFPPPPSLTLHSCSMCHHRSSTLAVGCLLLLRFPQLSNQLFFFCSFPEPKESNNNRDGYKCL